MQVISSREAQLQFGSFSREAQKDAVIVTSHGHPIFMAIPIKITANVVELIQKVSPSTTEETANQLEAFFQRLSQSRAPIVEMTETELSAFIKDPD
jgi:hypothetical protein